MADHGLEWQMVIDDGGGVEAGAPRRNTATASESQAFDKVPLRAHMSETENQGVKEADVTVVAVNPKKRWRQLARNNMHRL